MVHRIVDSQCGGLFCHFHRATVGLLVATLVALSVTPTRAQTPFSCTNGVSYRIQGNPSQLVTVNLRTGAATPLFSAATLGNRNLQGLGYNPLDNFLYASVSATNDIVRIGADGAVTLIDVPGLPADTYTTGDVGPDGLFYLYEASATTLRKVNLSTLAVTTITLTTGANLPDISISPDGASLYGISANNGNLVRYATSGGAPTATDVGFGGFSNSTYIDNTGNLYAIEDANSFVFEVVGPATPDPKSATLLATLFVANTNTDGARCILSSATTQTPFVCSAGQAFVVAGEQGYNSDECTDAGNSSLAEYNLVNGTLVSQTGQLINNFNARTTINNLGYNVTDNYLWGYRNGTNQLVRIGSEHTVDFFAISGLSTLCAYPFGTVNNTVFKAGDIDQNGVLYLFNGFDGDRFNRVDINPGSPTYLQKLDDVVLSLSPGAGTLPAVADLAFNPVDGNLYGVGATKHLIRIEPVTGLVTDVGALSGLEDDFSNFLIAFFDNEGSLYVQQSASILYKITNVAANNLTATVHIANAATVGLNGDGARCSLSTLVSLAISGTVFNDANGLLGSPVNTVDGTPISSLSGNIFYANLVNSSGNVVGTTTLTGGAYSFTGISANTSYSVVLSNTPGTIGSAPPSTSLTNGVLNTGENIGTTAGSDGTPNGVISVSVATSDVVNVNFGVNQLPTADAKTLNSQPNPGGTITVVVPTLTGSDPEDGIYTGTSLTNTIVIQRLPTTGVLHYDGIDITVGQVITNYEPNLLTVDPADGPVSVTFTFSERDAAGQDSPPALVTIPFSVVPDLAPVIFARPSSVYNTATISVIIDVFELLSVPTSGLITVKVPKDARFALSFDPLATSVNGRSVQNSAWTYAGLSGGSYTFTTTSVIAGNVGTGKLSVGMTGVLTPGATTGTITVSSVILGGSGGEIRIDNNNDADKIDYFQQ